MILLIKNKINSLLENERSRKLFKNVASSFIVKIVSMVVTLTLVPVSLKYTNESTYGVWLTLSSIITWFNLFDFGLSNGLTNKLTSCFALNKFSEARVYLSSTYAFLIISILGVNLLFLIASYFTNWNAVFNTTIDQYELKLSIIFTVLSFSCTFILKPLNDLLKASQKHFLLSIIQVSGNLVALFTIYFFGSMFDSKFLFLSITLGFSYPLSLIIGSIILFSTKYKQYIPSLKLVDKTCIKDILGISGKFFIIQISVIAILTSNNFLISYFVDNQNVTYFNIAYRLFSIVSIFQILIMTPLWPAFTDAYTLKDFSWIKSIVSKCNKLNLLLLIPLFIMFIFCDKIYEIWIGEKIKIPYEINLLMCIFIAITLFKETYVSFINGVGKLNLQTMFSIFTIIMQVPLAYLLTKIFGLGISGILLLNILWVAIGFGLWRLQYIIVIGNKISGKLWN